MSNLFLQNTLSNLFDTVTESNAELPQWINIIDNKKPVESSIFMNQQGGIKNNAIDSATSSAFMGQFGGAADSATSSAFIGQFGGKKSKSNKHVDSATSSAFIGQLGGGAESATSSAFIGQLGEADEESAFIGQLGGYNGSVTSSAMIGQNGGGGNISATSSAFMSQFNSIHNKTQIGGSNADVNKLVSMLTSESKNDKPVGFSETTTETLEAQLRDILKQDGGAKNKHDKTQKHTQTAGSSVSNVEDIRHFFTNLKSQGVNVNVKLNDKSLSEFFNLAQNTTTDVSELNLKNITGGAKKSKKTSKKSNDSDIDGGANAGFQAFLDFKKHVATKLKISNGPSAAKIAGAINADMKKKHVDLNAIEIAKKNTEYFDKNIDKVKSEFKDLIQKNPAK